MKNLLNRLKSPHKTKVYINEVVSIKVFDPTIQRTRPLLQDEQFIFVSHKWNESDPDPTKEIQALLSNGVSLYWVDYLCYFTPNHSSSFLTNTLLTIRDLSPRVIQINQGDKYNESIWCCFELWLFKLDTSLASPKDSRLLEDDMIALWEILSSDSSSQYLVSGEIKRCIRLQMIKNENF